MPKHPHAPATKAQLLSLHTALANDHPLTPRQRRLLNRVAIALGWLLAEQLYSAEFGETVQTAHERAHCLRLTAPFADIDAAVIFRRAAQD